ncbi:MAG: MFS transporter, partial [Steroidobacteraceae bacterium]
MAYVTSSPVTLDELIDSLPMSPAQVWVALLCALTLFIDGYDIQVMALAVPSLARNWSLPPSNFGLALSAVVIGISIGSGLLGPLGDRFGRRTVLIATLVVMSIATACTASARSPGEFVLWRLATGLALGAGIPNCAALTAEYSPLSNRSLVMGLMNLASPIGAFSAGFIAPPILDAFGWRGAFLLGGAVPLIIATLALRLPESLKFLALRRPTDLRIERFLRRIAPHVDPRAVRLQPPEHGARGAWLGPLGSRFIARTLLLWGLLFLNLFNLYVLVSWLATLLERSGWSQSAALHGAVMIQGGGIIGGLLVSRLMDRGATRAALFAGFALAAASLLSFGLVPHGTSWTVLLLLTGAGVSGCQLSLNTLSAAYYHPAIKATGVG